ncbi:MAG: transcriptional regulator [Cyclobacteriaceae bacterium]|jgi:HTH-type transcriptional regulator/antitoxin HigA|nr:transcriptional regulator [Cyclobacteriaceae bacterium]
MKNLKYTIIKSKTQYDSYCGQLENKLSQRELTPSDTDEIELLTLLIEKWDRDHASLPTLHPVALLQALKTEHHLVARDLVDILGVSKGYISDILNRKKGLSKGVIRMLATHFKMSQEAFNRPYALAKSGKRPCIHRSRGAKKRLTQAT